MVDGIKGHASISNAVVRSVFMHFATTRLPRLMQAQQSIIRAHAGEKIAIDATYRAVISLGAPDYSALTSTGNPKLVNFSASGVTIVFDSGFVAAVIVVPNDCQHHVAVALLSLFDVPPRGDDPLARRMHAIIKLGGSVRRMPRVICTDFITRDHRLWANVSKDIVASCLRQDIPVMVPAGVDASTQPLPYVVFLC